MARATRIMSRTTPITIPIIIPLDPLLAGFPVVGGTCFTALTPVTGWPSRALILSPFSSTVAISLSWGIAVTFPRSLDGSKTPNSTASLPSVVSLGSVGIIICSGVTISPFVARFVIRERLNLLKREKSRVQYQKGSGGTTELINKSINNNNRKKRMRERTTK